MLTATKVKSRIFMAANVHAEKVTPKIFHCAGVRSAIQANVPSGAAPPEEPDPVLLLFISSFLRRSEL